MQTANGALRGSVFALSLPVLHHEAFDEACELLAAVDSALDQLVDLLPLDEEPDVERLVVEEVTERLAEGFVRAALHRVDTADHARQLRVVYALPQQRNEAVGLVGD